MPKTVFTKREDLICGKLDIAVQEAISLKSFVLIDLLNEIRSDAERMEQKLISRKNQVEYHKNHCNDKNLTHISEIDEWYCKSCFSLISYDENLKRYV